MRTSQKLMRILASKKPVLELHAIQSSKTSSYSGNHLALPTFPSRVPSLTPSMRSKCTPYLTPAHRRSTVKKNKVLQNSEQRMLVLVLISIIVLFVCCTTPAAILSVLFSVKLDHHLGFQIFRACANNLELLNFALNFYIYCLCSAEIRRAFESLFKSLCNCAQSLCSQVTVQVEHV